jgi:2-polyprenyl-3-methyl-5-hydroxy-6-metoxy-1,4-benzoquinol methylase
MNLELDRLAKIASNSHYASGANGWTTAYSFNLMSRFIQGKNILEMGPAEGVMTHYLAQLGLSLTVVEGSQSFCDRIKKENPHVNVVHSLFEQFQPTEKFDNIILGHVLEHVENPQLLLAQVGKWLNHQGRVMVAVPNSRSIHRQAAVMLGLLKFEEELNDADRHHGHRRVYNPETFRREFLSAGFEIDFFGGYWLKPLSNKQIEDTWSFDMVQTFMSLGERYPDIAAELFIVAKRKVSA